MCKYDIRFWYHWKDLDQKIWFLKKYSETAHQTEEIQHWYKGGNNMDNIGNNCTAGYQSIAMVFGTLSEIYFVTCFRLHRLRQRNIERVMNLTDSFTWEDMPTRDAETGHLTKAGWIPRVNKIVPRICIVSMLFHSVQSTSRIVKYHETVLPASYPFERTVSPFYELVNISQVTVSIN
jgi:hypothetical protein